MCLQITKDIPLEALKGGVRYSGPTAGPAGKLENQVRWDLVMIWSCQESTFGNIRLNIGRLLSPQLS
jgi:hypothetical protein